MDQARSPSDLAHVISLVKAAPFNIISFGLCRLYAFFEAKTLVGTYRRVVPSFALSNNIRRPYFKVAKDAYRIWESVPAKLSS